MTATPASSTYLREVATPSPDAANPGHELPDAVRTVLGSHQKLRLLCVLDAGDKTLRELGDAVAGTMRPQAINMHLKELHELGWIKIAGGEKQNPYDPLRWELTTPPMWRELAATIVARTSHDQL